MASYFRQVPEFEYISRLPDGKNIGDFVVVKNLFKRVEIRQDILQNLAYFTQYKIQGDDRPDLVAFKNYGDETLDWLVLLSNNIMNIQNEWPMTNAALHDYLIKKYGSYEKIEGIHHYESQEVKNANNVVLIRKGIEVPADYKLEYYETKTGQYVTKFNIADAITNYTYELRKEENKRNIYLLKPEYAELVINEIQTLMPYKKGSAQYVNRTLKRGEDIRLFN